MIDIKHSDIKHSELRADDRALAAEMIAIISERGWTQHQLVSERGEVCVAGAAILARYRRQGCDGADCLDSYRMGHRSQALNYEHQAWLWRFSAALGIEGARVGNWNDLPHHTQEDILLTLKEIAHGHD